MYIHETKLKVRYVETDQMGIVHHSKYYPWFEIARGEFITETGMSYRDMEEAGIMMPVLESSCKYIQGAKYEDNLIIQAWISEMNPVKVIFNYNVVREKDDKIIAKGSTKHTFVNDDFKIVNIKKMKPEIWSKLQNINQ
ncbi:thioesterase [Vallitalea longa]|uniref:Thioesterase n=1 Tax=Vallitalea longa TaxID=2936439 RepID=A0A9W5Y9V5_9FIRM|nr:thioesterase family protein [Vallitalea longa]GKX28586.1 thioesterase [Vallitalea longa]